MLEAGCEGLAGEVAAPRRGGRHGNADVAEFVEGGAVERHVVELVDGLVNPGGEGGAEEIDSVVPVGGEDEGGVPRKLRAEIDRDRECAGFGRLAFRAIGDVGKRVRIVFAGSGLAEGVDAEKFSFDGSLGAQYDGGVNGASSLLVQLALAICNHALVVLLGGALGGATVAQHECCADAQAVGVCLIHDARDGIVAGLAVNKRDAVAGCEEGKVEFGVLRDVMDIGGITAGRKRFRSDEPVQQFREVRVENGILIVQVDVD